MNANELLMYLKGFFENIHVPNKQQISAIRDVVLNSTLVEPGKEIVPVHVQVPMINGGYPTIPATGGCSSGNCGKPAPGDKGPSPYIDGDRF